MDDNRDTDEGRLSEIAKKMLAMPPKKRNGLRADKRLSRNEKKPKKRTTKAAAKPR
jgi:hypothetical protein